MVFLSNFRSNELRFHREASRRLRRSQDGGFAGSLCQSTRLLLAAISVLFVAAPETAHSQSNDITAHLEYRYGKRKVGDAYVWRVGPFDSYKTPRNRLSEECEQIGGQLVHSIDLQDEVLRSTLTIAEFTRDISARDLWNWSKETFDRYRSANAVGPTSYAVTFPIPSWARSDAFGLFECRTSGSAASTWAVAIMVEHPNFVTIHAIDENALARLHAEDLRKLESDRAAQQDRETRLAIEIEEAQEKEAFIEEWRDNLNIGDQTSCGLIIEINGPIIKLQLPSTELAPNGATEIWINRDDALPREGGNWCRVPI